MKKYSKEEIEINKNNTQWIYEEIEQSNGFILYKMKEYKIYPNKDILINQHHPIAIQFLIDNYDLTIEEKTNIMDLLSSSGKDKKLFKDGLDQDTLDDFLSKEKEIPEDSILSLDIIIKHANYLLEEDSYKIENVLKNSFQKITINDFSTIPDEIKKKYPWIYTYNKRLFKNRNYGIEYYELVKNKKNSLSLKTFSYFPFEEKDLDMIDKILKDSHYNEFHSNNYQNLVNLKLDRWISKLEYFKKYNPKDVTIFDLEEVQKYKKEIQDVLLKSQKEHWRRGFNAIHNASIKLNQLELLMDDQFFEKLKKQTSEYRLFNYIDKDFPKERKEKEIFLRNYYMDTMIKKIPKISLDEINIFLEVAKHVFYEFNYLQEEEKNKVLEKIKKITDFVLEKDINNHNINFFLKLEKNIFAMNNEDFSNKNFDKFVNPNAFFFLIKMWKEYSSQREELERISQINCEHMIVKVIEKLNDKNFFKDKKIQKNYQIFFLKIIDYLENQDTKHIRKGFQNELSELKKILLPKDLLNKIYIQSINFEKDDYNFLTYDVHNLDDVQYPEIIQQIEPNFVEEYFQEKKQWPKNLFRYFINNADQKENQIILKRYIEMFQKEIENSSYLESILKSPYQKYFYVNHSFEKDEKLLKEIKDLDQYQKSLRSKEKILSQKLNTEAYRLSDKLNFDKIEKEKNWDSVNIAELNPEDQMKGLLYFYKQCEKISKEIEPKQKQISFSFLENYLLKQLKNENYEEIIWLDQNHYLYHLKDNIKEYFNNMSYEQFLKNIENPYFLKTIYSLTEINEKQILQLQQFTNEQCKEITNHMLKAFQKNKIFAYTSENTMKYYLEKIFYLFDQEKVDFIKDYMRENYPEYLLYSYNYQIGSLYHASLFIKEPYSKEELLEIYESIYKKYKTYIIYTDTNDRISNFMKNMLSGHLERHKMSDKEKEKEMEKYLEKINFFKEKNPAIYLLSIYSEITNAFNTNWGKKKDNNQNITKDESENMFLNEYVDIPKTLEGIKMFLDTFESPHISRKDKEEIKSLIQNFNFQLYFENNNIYNSYLSEEKSVMIADFFIKHYPLLLFKMERFAGIENMQDYIKEYKKDYYSLENIQNILYPKEDMIPAYFALENNQSISTSGQEILKFFKNAIDYAVTKNDLSIIEYLAFEIESYQFVEKNFDYEKKAKYYHNKQNISTMIIDFLQENEEMNEYFNKVKLKIVLDKNLIENKVKNKFNKI